MNAFLRGCRRGFALVSLCVAAGGIAPAATPDELSAEAVELMSAGRVDDAVAKFDEVVQRSPKSASARINRAIARIAAGQFEGAVEDCNAAEELTSDHGRILQLRATAQSELGRHRDALADISRAVRREPGNATFVYTRFLVCLRMGRLDLAPSACETYIGIKGWGDESAHYMALLGWLAHRRNGNDDLARARIEEARTFLPDTTTWPAPVVLLCVGELSEAELLALADTDAQTAVARYYLGVLADFAGDRERARTHWQWVLDHADTSLLQRHLARHDLARTSSE